MQQPPFLPSGVCWLTLHPGSVLGRKADHLPLPTAPNLLLKAGRHYVVNPRCSGLVDHRDEIRGVGRRFEASPERLPSMLVASRWACDSGWSVWGGTGCCLTVIDGDCTDGHEQSKMANSPAPTMSCLKLRQTQHFVPQMLLHVEVLLFSALQSG